MTLLWISLLLHLEAKDAQEPNTPSSSDDEKEWFCSHNLPWEQCKAFLPSEQDAVRRFLHYLRDANEPTPGEFKGRGIVMSGGPGHVLQAIANLRIIRHVLGSDLPVEFWHAFELQDSHCRALRAFGAECRSIRLPGVYPLYQTVLPAIMLSSFRHVFWMDTDITPLVKPDILLDSATYAKEGAMFWPDFWGLGCVMFGETAWPNFIGLDLLGLQYNGSDLSFAAEHEAGHLLIDKQRHWKPLCLANYFASRDFFTRIMHGYKDVFRMAWLALNASNWFTPVMPGLVGLFNIDGRFIGNSMLHFWPAGGEFGPGHHGRHVPLYIHQKKKPGQLWQQIVTFRTPLGSCAKFVNSEAFDPYRPRYEADVWDLDQHSSTMDAIQVADAEWEEGWRAGVSQIENDPDITPEELASAIPPKRVGTNRGTVEYLAEVYSCRCDYQRNLWFNLITRMKYGHIYANETECDEVLADGLDPSSCPVGYVALALLCFQTGLRFKLAEQARASIQRMRSLLPSIRDCLGKSFWPFRLEDVDGLIAKADGADLTAETAREDVAFKGSMDIPWDQLGLFAAHYRRCVPLKDLSCWTLETEAPFRCFDCCNKAVMNRHLCFDEQFTEERCCNAL